MLSAPSILAKVSEKYKLSFSHGVLLRMKTRVCLKYSVHDCSSSGPFSIFDDPRDQRSKTRLENVPRGNVGEQDLTLQDTL